MIQVNTKDLYQALSELARCYQFRNRDEVCCYGLTVSQCYALQTLYDSKLLTGTMLAHDLGLDLSSTTRVLDQLVRKKLITRRKKAVDQRVREIELTPAGIRLMERIEADMTQILGGAMSKFPVEVQKALPQALRELTAILHSCREGGCQKNAEQTKVAHCNC